MILVSFPYPQTPLHPNPLSSWSVEEGLGTKLTWHIYAHKMQYAHATCCYACMCELHAHYSSATWQTQSQDCSYGWAHKGISLPRCMLAWSVQNTMSIIILGIHNWSSDKWLSKQVVSCNCHVFYTYIHCTCVCGGRCVEGSVISVIYFLSSATTGEKFSKVK